MTMGSIGSSSIIRRGAMRLVKRYITPIFSRGVVVVAKQEEREQ